MTAIADPLQLPCGHELSCGFALTLPAEVAPSLALSQSRLKLEAQPQQSPSYVNASADISAMVALATALNEAPHTVCQLLAGSMLTLLKAGSAGVSVLSTQSDGAVLVSWPAIAGRWQSYGGGSRLLLAPVASPEPTAEHCLVIPFAVAG